MFSNFILGTSMTLHALEEPVNGEVNNETDA